MSILQNMKIRYKLMAIVMVACVTGLILAGAAFLGWEQIMLRDSMVKVLSTRAAIIAENCKASLAFQDNKDAEKILQSLYVDSSVVFGGVYDNDNKLFAGYYRNGKKIKASPAKFKEIAFKFTKESLIISRPIILDDQIIGTVCLQSDLDFIHSTLKRGLQIIIAVILLSLLAVLLISTQLQGVVSKPILSLASLAKTVSEKKDYTARAFKHSNDEVGLLIDAFNEMLKQIQRRDSELLDAKEGLEIKVQERTADLSKANEQMAVEIAERKKAEEEIRKSQKILQDMINAMPFGVVVVGKDRKITQANAAAYRLSGYEEGELMECLCHDTLCPADKDHCPIFNLGQKVDLSERKLVRKDKTQIPIIKSVIPMRLGDEDVLLEAFVDITRQKEAEESMKELNQSLEEANKEMKNFVYIASHDLREPLRKITAFGTMLQTSLEGKLDPDDSENLHFMIDGSQRMNKMIEGLLIYSRVSSKIQPPQTVDLNEIVSQLQQLELSMLLQEKQVVMEVPQPLPSVEVDPVQIRQLMQNLIANGVKYQKKGNIPHITITSKPAANDMVRVEITDNGIGIKPEYMQSMFVMFKRLHTREEYEGTGIGLAVCKKIVERHGGQIGVESQPDKGSTFWFTVPLAYAPVTTTANAERTV